MSRWRTLLRILPRAALLATPGLNRFLARRRWPKTQGTLSMPGLRAPVEVIRDRWGTPHLYARDEHDLFFAQGYVHAQDRLFQMELGRWIGNGTVAAAVGPGGLATDRLIRTLGLRQVAEKAWASMQGEVRGFLEAYAAGVNARISGEPLPVEFPMMGVSPSPWTPVDTLVRANLFSMMLSGNHRLEILRARMVAEAGEAIAAALLPPNAPESPIIVPPEARRYEGLRGVAAFEGLDGMDRMLGDPNIVSGSNNWVVHGSRTESGKPLLANDVHIGLGIPGAWYENGLHGGRFDLVGHSLAGGPFVQIGHNGKIAWGMSNLGPDTQDFYLEKVDDPKAPTRYEYQGEWHGLELRKEEIPVLGQTPVTLTVQRTRHGPIMNGAMTRLLEGQEPMALRWALEDCRPLMDAVMQMNLAQTCEEFRAALKLWEMPGQNFVFADAQGNIGYQATGKIPVRPRTHGGLVPMPGWTGEYEWLGWIPFEELPHAMNPETGFLATANNKITSDDYPYLIAHNWFPGYRAKRITDLLAQGRRHTVADMQRIQGETYSIPAETLRPYLLQAVQQPGNALEAQALEEVRAWDLRFETDRVGATVYETWYVHLLRRLLAHKLGPDLVQRYLASDYERHGSMHMPMVIRLMSDPENEWFHDPEKPGKQTRDDVVRLCFQSAVAKLAERWGPDPKGWNWGRMHQVTMYHQPFGHSLPKPLRRVFNSRTLQARGDTYSVDGASFLWSAPYEVVHGTAQRMVVDLSDFSKSVGIHTPGQVEHVFHPHREDLMEMSQRLEYHPLLFTREAVLAHAEATLTLEPEKG